MHIAKMTSDGQVTIPAEIRSKLGLEEGDELVLFLDGWKVQMFKRRSRA
ncbi:MAG: AbrB/MazE/SpoVT family DNA-binding domain-containing protein [Hormoscilla sp. SP5CHS1]|nr:AbrB/MazE/SpoVT family DNA-binding domain-containing protein [Hormoscilla sp. SP12CHS1]MBC6455845.1 AbrB/MazE/SpoVT family DNA-binding domain-containing protein [Hormoscilla sp. SP5CHS1]MBC6475379.1 AbrB/MazE/SpoVT family DNA-binding domain-containing protein [Hormoscilla sp. GM102CHS1]